MKSFLKFILICSVILLASAVLAPFLFTFLPFKFERIFNRLVMIFSLIAVFLFLRRRSLDWKTYGLIRPWPEARIQFFKGFAASLLVLGLLTWIRSSIGFAQISFSGLSWTVILGKFIHFLLAGLLIAVIEEFFFRGFMDETLRIRFRIPVVLSVILASLFYASLHFVSKKKIWIDQTPDFFDSLRLMTAPFLAWGEGGIWPAFTGLFLFGCVLHFLRLRTQSLYPGMGLHAGCVFFVKSDGMFVDVLKSPTLWMGSKVFYDGILGWISILVLGAALYVWLNPRAVSNPSISK